MLIWSCLGWKSGRMYVCLVRCSKAEVLRPWISWYCVLSMNPPNLFLYLMILSARTGPMPGSCWSWLSVAVLMLKRMFSEVCFLVLSRLSGSVGFLGCVGCWCGGGWVGCCASRARVASSRATSAVWVVVWC